MREKIEDAVAPWLVDSKADPRLIDAILAAIGEGQEPVAVYMGREGEYGYEVVSLDRRLEAGTNLYAAPQPAPDVAAMQELVSEQRIAIGALSKRNAELEQRLIDTYEAGKRDGWEACETCHGIVDGVHQRSAELERVQGVLVMALTDCESRLSLLINSGRGKMLDAAAAEKARAALAAVQKPAKSLRDMTDADFAAVLDIGVKP